MNPAAESGGVYIPDADQVLVLALLEYLNTNTTETDFFDFARYIIRYSRILDLQQTADFLHSLSGDPQ